jgi:hypothetical protein
MTKVVLQKPTSGFNLAAINDNFIKLEDELNNKILYRNNPEGEPNQLRTDVDVNGVRLYNLREPLSPSEAARLQDVTNAISGATTANLISFTPVGTISSTNVQAAIAELLAELPTVAASTPVTTTYSNFTMNASTPNGRQEFMSTNPSGFNTGVGKFTLEYEFVSNNYFLYNPNAHIATVLRQDPATVATTVTGNGAIMGNLTWSGFNGDQALFTPVMMLETWDPTRISTQRLLFPDSTTPRNKLLVDGARYKVSVESVLYYNSAKYIRYRLWKYSGATTKYWELQNDTGHVLDHNGGADFSKSGFMFAAVFLDNLGTWSIDFSNIKGTWGPPETVVSDQTAKLNKFGADVAGDMEFTTTSQRFKFPFSTGPSLLSFFTFQSSTANSPTSLLFKPSGSGTSSNLFFSNNSTSDTVYQCFDVGIASGKGYIQTFNRGSTDPTIEIRPGTVSVVSFGATGMTLAGASKAFGASLGWSANLVNWTGSNVNAFNSVANIDWNGTCAVGNIASGLGGTYSASNIETYMRPLWCIIGSIVQHLKDTKTATQ